MTTSKATSSPIATRATVDEQYGLMYKIMSIIIYVILSIGMEELNQKMYRKGFKYIFTSIGLQQVWIMFMYPLTSMLGMCPTGYAPVDNIVGQFVLEIPTMKAFFMLGISAFVWCANVGLLRVVSFTVGSGPLDVMKALIVPFSAFNVWMYYGKKQTKICMVGILVMTVAFIVYLPNLKDKETGVFKWSLLMLGLGVGVVNSHQTLVSQHFLKYVDNNAMKMLIGHTPWAVVYFAIMAYLNGEFNGYDFLSGSYKVVLANSNGAECLGVMDKLRNDPDVIPYLIAVIFMGFVINIATMNLLQAISVVTNNVTGQGKSALGSVIGYTNVYLDLGTVPTKSQIIATALKAVGGSVYTFGKLKAAGKIGNKEEPAKPTDLSDMSDTTDMESEILDGQEALATMESGPEEELKSKPHDL